MTIVVLDRQNKRIAFSDIGMRLCKNEVARVNSDLKDSLENLESVVGFAIEGVTGAVKSLGAIKLDLAERHIDYRYLDKKVALQKLPNSTKGLINSPCSFREYDEGNSEWREAPWAIEICDSELPYGMQL